MILLLSSLASAVTVEVGASGAYPSMWKAYPAVYVEGEVTEFVLLPDYDYSQDTPLVGTLDLGMAISTEVIIRSSEPGVRRRSVPVHAYQGATVKLVDVEIVVEATGFADPLNSGAGSYNYVPALLVTDGSHLIAENVRVADQTFRTYSGVAMAFGADLTLIRCEFVGNTPARNNVNPNEAFNYTVGMRENGPKGNFTLTLEDTVIQNASGPAVALYSEYSPQTLNITGGSIATVTSEVAGSAVFTYGQVNTNVTGLYVESAANTAVRLSSGDHTWEDISFFGAKGAQGAAFHLSDGGNLTLSDVRCEDCYASEAGGLAYLRNGTSLAVKGLDMLGGGGRDAGAIYAEGVALYIKNSRLCGVDSQGAMFSTSSDLVSTNNVFRSMVSYNTIFGGSGGNLEAVNNTFVDLPGSVMGGAFSELTFVNNAVANVESLNVGEAPADVFSTGYNLFFGLTDMELGGGRTLGEGNLVNTDPQFSEDFESDRTDCSVDPLPAAGSPLIDGGDPGILDSDGSRSDIGAFGGPGAEDTEVSWSPGDGEVLLMGGCSSAGTSAAFLLFLPLLGLRRRRRARDEADLGG